MDYTPGGFANVTREEFVPQMDHPMVMTTRAHQLAMYVVFEAAFQMVSDCPANYEGQPAFDFIKAVPSTWDETHVVNGLVGQYITVARRHGDNWFVGSMANSHPRELDISLSFLGEGKYTADIYADGKDANTVPEHVDVSSQTVGRGDTLHAHLLSAGGYAVRLRPAEK